MIKCVKCGQVDSINRSGFVRGRQRFYCKVCNYYFLLPSANPLPSRKKHQTTIVDIARSLGVSPSTVSRALHGHIDISPATREAIVEAANALEYQPNLLALSLNSRETHVIGVVIPDIERPFFASTVSGIQQVASASGYRVMICQSNESHQMEVSNVQALVANRVDGLLICHSKETQAFDHIKLLVRKGIPMVHFDRVCGDVATTKVIQDDHKGAYAVVRHLLEEGCRRIAILSGPPALTISQQRLQGYLDAHADYGLPVAEDLIFHGDFRKETALAALSTWLEMDSPPNGIFSVYDGGAVDIMMALREAGVSVPEQIVVAGFGNEPVAAVIQPGLTTIHQHPIEIGKKAAQLFLEQIIHPGEFTPQTYVVPGELIIRASSRRKKV